jgi:small subunit ribosomal protein S19
MARALWKGPFVDASLLRKNRRRVWSRRSVILPEFVHEFFEIHNGKEFLRVQILEEMIGHRFGEFASTRKKTLHPKKTRTRS